MLIITIKALSLSFFALALTASHCFVVQSLYLCLHSQSLLILAQCDRVSIDHVQLCICLSLQRQHTHQAPCAGPPLTCLPQVSLASIWPRTHTRPPPPPTTSPALPSHSLWGRLSCGTGLSQAGTWPWHGCAKGEREKKSIRVLEVLAVMVHCKLHVGLCQAT